MQERLAGARHSFASRRVTAPQSGHRCLFAYASDFLRLASIDPGLRRALGQIPERTHLPLVQQDGRSR